MALETDPCSPANSPSKSAFHQIASSPDSSKAHPHRFDKPSFQIRRIPEKKRPSRPVSNESSSIDRHPYSDGSPPSSPTSTGLAYVPDSHVYHPDMASLSLVYGLGVGVVPNRFPLGLRLPAVYPDVDRGFPGLPRVPTVLPVETQDPFSVFAGGQRYVDGRIVSAKPVTKPPAKDECGCCVSPAGPGKPTRSPTPSPPPGPSALAFSVDNILRPDFGRSKQQHSQQSCSRRSRTSKNVMKSPSSSETESSPAGKSDRPDPSSDQEKDANGQMWPAWVYCTRYSDRPSSGEF